jgi:hypothetical protein
VLILEPDEAGHLAAAANVYRSLLASRGYAPPPRWGQLVAALARIGKQPPPDPLDQLPDRLTLDEAAVVAGESRRTLERRAAAGRLTLTRAGGRTYVTGTDLADYVRSRDKRWQTATPEPSGDGAGRH